MGKTFFLLSLSGRHGASLAFRHALDDDTQTFTRATTTASSRPQQSTRPHTAPARTPAARACAYFQCCVFPAQVMLLLLPPDQRKGPRLSATHVRLSISRTLTLSNTSLSPLGSDTSYQYGLMGTSEDCRLPNHLHNFKTTVCAGHRLDCPEGFARARALCYVLRVSHVRPMRDRSAPNAWLHQGCDLRTCGHHATTPRPSRRRHRHHPNVSLRWCGRPTKSCALAM